MIEEIALLSNFQLQNLHNLMLIDSSTPSYSLFFMLTFYLFLPFSYYSTYKIKLKYLKPTVLVCSFTSLVLQISSLLFNSTLFSFSERAMQGLICGLQIAAYDIKQTNSKFILFQQIFNCLMCLIASFTSYNAFGYYHIAMSIFQLSLMISVKINPACIQQLETMQIQEKIKTQLQFLFITLIIITAYFKLFYASLAFFLYSLAVLIVQKPQINSEKFNKIAISVVKYLNFILYLILFQNQMALYLKIIIFTITIGLRFFTRLLANKISSKLSFKNSIISVMIGCFVPVLFTIFLGKGKFNFCFNFISVIFHLDVLKNLLAKKVELDVNEVKKEEFNYLNLTFLLVNMIDIDINLQQQIQLSGILVGLMGVVVLIIYGNKKTRGNRMLSGI